MKCLLISEIKKKSSPFLLGAMIFNTTEYEENDFLVYSHYKKIKDQKIIDEQNKILNKLSGFDVWNVKNKNINKKHWIYLKNDVNYSYNRFIKYILSIIYEKSANWDGKEKKEFLSGFFELRCSLDLSANYLSIDFLPCNRFVFSIKFNILNNLEIINIMNFNLNFREFQEDYSLNNNKRNTQLRIKLAAYIKNYGFLLPKNIYLEKKNIKKIKVLNSDFSPNNKAIKRMHEYFELVFNRETPNITKDKFLSLNESLVKKSLRKFSIVNAAKQYLTDECFGCYEKYNINSRTFNSKLTKKAYLEIHHVISFSNNPCKLDNIENLVKLCPVCHTALTGVCGRAEESYCKDIIESIISHRETQLYFISAYYDVASPKANNSKNELINKIFNDLR